LSMGGRTKGNKCGTTIYNLSWGETKEILTKKKAVARERGHLRGGKRAASGHQKRPPMYRRGGSG